VFRSWQYQMTLALIASANIVCQAAKTAGDSSAKRSTLDNAELGFTLFFLAEVIVKLLVLKRAYFLSGRMSEKDATLFCSIFIIIM